MFDPFKRHHLHYFVTVAEEGQITLAAEKLHIAQPALSQAMAQLESDLGLQLFERHARGVTLTPAGEVFLEKARGVLAASEDAFLTAQSLARTGEGSIVFGYLGLPPAVTNPHLIETFTQAHPGIGIILHELPFPTRRTASWLRAVDAAICTRPTADANVSLLPLRAEPRVVLIPVGHRLAQRRELAVAEVLDETFIGFDESIDPAWAGFWSLDDHRHGQRPRLIGNADNAHGRFELLAEGRGIAVVPACHAAAIASVLGGIVVVPLADADPAILTLVSRNDCTNPLVKALFATARGLASIRPVPGAR